MRRPGDDDENSEQQAFQQRMPAVAALPHDDIHLSRLRWLRAAEAVEKKLAELARVHIAELEAAALRRRPGEGGHKYIARGMRSDWLLAALRVKLALMRLGDLGRKAGFDPDQPRVPAGNSDGGQWTRVGDSTEAQPSRTDESDSNASVAARGNEAECDAQYQRDIALCNMVRTPLCYAQAMERYAACLGGRQIPVLRF